MEPAVYCHVHTWPYPELDASTALFYTLFTSYHSNSILSYKPITGFLQSGSPNKSVNALHIGKRTRHGYVGLSGGTAPWILQMSTEWWKVFSTPQPIYCRIKTTRYPLFMEYDGQIHTSDALPRRKTTRYPLFMEYDGQIHTSAALPCRKTTRYPLFMEYDGQIHTSAALPRRKTTRYPLFMEYDG